MSIETSMKVVDKATGATIFTVDETGIRDSSSRVFQPSEFIFDRIAPTPLAAYIWACLEGVWQIQAVRADMSVTGGASCTVTVLVCPPGTAPGSGTAQLTAPIDIEETAPFSVSGTLIASPTPIFPGMIVSRLIAGTVGSVEGSLTIQLKRIN